MSPNMPTLKAQIIELLHTSPGMTDREITDRLRGPAADQQPINMAARQLAAAGTTKRAKRGDGLTGNYLMAHDAASRALALPVSRNAVTEQS